MRPDTDRYGLSGGRARMMANMPVAGPPSTFEVPPEQAGRRLDQFLVGQLPEVSRARVQQLIGEGKVLVNETAAKPSLKLKGGERIQVLGRPMAAPLRAIAEDIPLDVIYEDEDLAVINKPAPEPGRTSVTAAPW